MATIDELAARKAKILESAPEVLANDAIRIQKQLWEQLTPLINSLEVDSQGNIVQSVRNINKISAIINSLNILLAGDEYRDAVRQFLSSLDENIEITNEIAKQIRSGFEPNEYQRRLIELVRAQSLSSLVSDGLRNAVSRPFAQQLIANVTSKAPLRDAVKSLRLIIEGDSTTDGRIAANVKTVATTAQAVSDREYSNAVYEDLGIEYFKYIGGEIETTRPFCEHRVGKVFHRKEIEAWGNGKNAGGIKDIKNGTWDGRIRDTNEQSIFTNLGGWNCRHSLVPVVGRLVPKEVIERAREEGYI